MQEEFLPARLVTYGFADSLPKDDDRIELYKKQRQERGFDDTELWSLDCTIAAFIAPRLKEFAKQTCGNPVNIASFEDWQEILRQMVVAFDLMADKDRIVYTDEEDKLISDGLDLFRKYFHGLWW